MSLAKYASADLLRKGVKACSSWLSFAHESSKIAMELWRTEDRSGRIGRRGGEDDVNDKGGT
jgi:hypothetical protein